MSQTLTAQPRLEMHAEDAALRAQLETIATSEITGKSGKLAIFALQWNTGRSVGLQPDLPVQTASVIKLSILYEAMVAVREGRARWDETIILKPENIVGGSGMLHFFDSPLTLTLKDVLTLMVIVSDNTATNLAIDRFGIDKVNARVESLGLKQTHLYKKVFKPAEGPMPDDQPKFGLGKTTPREMAALMETIGRCQLRRASDAQASAVMPDSTASDTQTFLPMDAADKAVCDVALQMLKSQFYRETIPRYLPNGGDQTVASKTGSLDAVRNDVALVAGKTGPMVLSIFTYDNQDTSWAVDNEAEVTIARLAKAIVDAWSPLGLDPKGMVAGMPVP